MLIQMGFFGMLAAAAALAIVGVVIAGSWALVGLFGEIWDTCPHWLIWTILATLGAGFIGGVLFPFLVPPPQPESEERERN